MGKVKIYDLAMSEIKLRGSKWLEFTPDPPTSERTTEKVNHGDIVLGKKRNSRMIQAKLWYKSDDFLDYKKLMKELYSILDPLKSFYIVDTQIPGERWSVEIEDFNPKRINDKTAEIAVTLYSSKPHAESIITTLSPELAYFDIGPQTELNMKKYVHGLSTFKVYNAGTEIIDPRESELLITINSISASSTVLSLKNNTTGDEWKYTGAFSPGDVITINRTKSKRNGLNIVGKTNLDLISLARGQNEFVVTGLIGDFEISFEFRYLYV